MSKNYRGIYINTIKLRDYPLGSQQLMKKIKDDLPFNVIELDGSYSIKSKSGKTAVKILCVHESNVSIGGNGIAVLFKYDYIEKQNIENVDRNFKLLSIEKHIVAVGRANHIEDFYYTKVENDEIYNKKKEDIINLTKEIIKY